MNFSRRSFLGAIAATLAAVKLAPAVAAKESPPPKPVPKSRPVMFNGLSRPQPTELSAMLIAQERFAAGDIAEIEPHANDHGMYTGARHPRGKPSAFAVYCVATQDVEPGAVGRFMLQGITTVRTK